MSSRRPSPDVDDADNYGDDFYEIPLVDLTDEEEADPAGPVDIHGRTATLAEEARSASSLVTKKADRYCPEVFVQSCRSPDDSVITVGDTVELEMPKSRSQGLQSGDFLKVLKIVKNLNTDETILRGHKFVREKYTLGRGSDGSMARLNEVMMHLEVHEDDNRPAEVQGMVDVSATEVKSKREIITTQKPYPMKSFRDGSMETYQRLRSKEDIKREIFSRGPLVCRWSRTSIISPNGTAYGGILRLLSRKEVMIPTQLRDSQFPLPQPMSRTSPAQLAHQSQLREARIGKRPARTPSLETLDTPPQKRPATHPMKKKQYTFFDMYCGAGGASRGAVNAGLQVLGGLDFNENAMEAWGKNYPGGLPFCCNAFDFLGKKLWRILGRTDVLNISFPCQPYSSAHTKPGKYDEINIKALDTIKLAIEHMKPRLVVLENTSGLANFKKNQAHFNRVLRNITTAGPGYSVAYKIINMADYGVPQQRKRLIIIAARRGTPLPAFPKPLHGPDGSGLLPFISIGDALESLVRQGARAHKHRYHRPNEMPRIDGVPYDAYSKFVDCIMTSGVTSCHPNGKRAFTPLELALLQTLPFHHQLTGTWTDAIKQVGNMFPPLMAEQVYRVCAQTLEAFDHGLIGAEDELEDLDITLIEKGVMIPEPPSTSSSFIDLTGEFKQSEYPYRYLIPPQLSDAQHSGYSSLFAHRSLPGRPAPQERKDRAPRIIMNSDDEFSRTSPPPREKKPAPSKSRQERRFWEQFNGGLIDLSIEDDDDEKEKV